MNLKDWRESLNWSQGQAANELGITRSTYQRLERGIDWKTGKPVIIDRRTELACQMITLNQKRRKI
jgi:DNA-binding XRE family transcriptional regulator